MKSIRAEIANGAVVDRRKSMGLVSAGDRKEERPMKGLTTPLKNERGVAVPLMAICMVALAAFAAIGIDTGRVASVANEVQNAADIAATAATLAMLEDEDATAAEQETLAQDGAEDALELNKVNGGVATTSLQELEVGYMAPDYSFTAGLQPYNAARAQTGTVVDNILLDILGWSQATVSREAIATFAGLGSGIPTLPIVIGECNFNADCYHQSCMPYLSQVPDPGDNSAWTAFFDSASNSNIDDYFPALGHPACGEGVEELITVGDIINLGNGQVTPLLRAVQCLLDEGMNEFTIPIVECVGNFNQPKKVVGFAKIVVDYVVETGTGHGIWLHGLYEGKQPGPPGGGQFGLLAVNLVK
jgi:hypothetical protein